MKNPVLFFFLICSTFYSCIGDDFIADRVEPIIQINNAIDTLAVGDMFQLQTRFLNNVGAEESANIVWESSEPTIATVDDSGLVTGLLPGDAVLTASTEYEFTTVSQQIDIAIGDNTVVVEEPTVRMGTIVTTSSYALGGDFTLSENNGAVILQITDNYRASTALPGLYIYMTNNPATNIGALELGRVEVFSGAHSYTLPVGTDINEYNYILYYCKPFSVKVGDGKISN